MIRLKVDITGKLDLSHVDANAVAMEGARAVYAEVLHSLDEMGRASQSRYFWPEAAQSVTPPRLDGKMAVVLITKKGVRLHWKGGTVRPSGKTSRVTGRPIKSLLVPFDDSPIRRRSLAEAGYDPKEVMVLQSENGRPYLAHVRKYMRKVNGKTAKVTPLGYFLKSATIEAKPEVMPSAETFQTSVRQAVRQYLDLLCLRFKIPLNLPFAKRSSTVYVKMNICAPWYWNNPMTGTTKLKSWPWPTVNMMEPWP